MQIIDSYLNKCILKQMINYKIIVVNSQNQNNVIVYTNLSFYTYKFTKLTNRLNLLTRQYCIVKYILWRNKCQIQVPISLYQFSELKT